MNLRLYISIISMAISLLTLCQSSDNTCKYDTDCRWDKVCRNGECIGLYENLDIYVFDSTSQSDERDGREITDDNTQDKIAIAEDIGEDIYDSDIQSDSTDDLVADAYYDVPECLSPCEYEGKRYCQEDGYVECQIIEGDCPEPVFKKCEESTICRNGICGRDECQLEDKYCINTEEYIACESDNNGFYRIKSKRCDIGTECKRSICCPIDMVEIDGFCIDKYEAIVSDNPTCTGIIYGQQEDNYPTTFPDDVDIEKNPPETNLYTCSRKEVMPSVFITYYQAKIVCKISGKRLCTIEEYISACTGNNRTYNYPYGSSWLSDRCNDTGFLGTPAKTGSFPSCVSSFEAYDMSGNVEEWAEPTQDVDNPVAMGGNAGCRYRDKDCSMCSAAKGYSPLTTSKTLGFRCCK